MKTQLSVLILAASATLLTGCTSPNGEPDNTGTGALVGGASGAAIGAAVGGRNAGAGALIGAAAGLITGGLIGHSIDQQQQAELQREAPQTYVRVEQRQPLGTTDIKALAKAGVGDDVIISQINNSHTVYHLSTADIIDLHAAGVSEKVIDYMINTANSPQAAAETTTVVQEAPPPPPSETVVVSPGPGYVWVGGEWVWNGRWVWIGGHWGYPPHPHAIWVRGYWVHDYHGWHRAPGHWR